MTGAGTRTAVWCDRVLDAVVVLVASWTLVYDVCLVLRWGTTWAVVLELASLLLAIALARRPGSEAVPEDDASVAGAAPARARHPRLGQVLVLLTVAMAVLAAVATASSGPWWLVWVPWLIGAASGSAWAVLGLRTGRPPVPEAGTPTGPTTGSTIGPTTWSTTGVLAWAVGLAGFSMFTLRPNPDDLFYVNLSQWVAEHGEFPVRDTLFSELAYPMANWPPMASYEGLIGTVARVGGVHAASVEYLVVPPVATALAVLALWRLLRAWRVRHLFWVLSTALVFLLFDGTASYASPGNLFLTRLWQGKVVLLCVLVPVLLVHALRYVETPSRRRLVPLVLGGVASVGLTTTGMFLTPLLALAGMAPLAVRDLRRAGAGFAALAGYPLVAGVVTIALGGRSADDFGARRLYRFDASWIGSQLLLSELVGFVVVAALLLGALLVPHPAARVTTGLLTLLTGCVFIPGAMRLSYDLTGLGPTLWRISWAASIAALVGVLAVSGGGRLVASACRPGRDRWARATPAMTGLLVMALLAGFGPPIWGAATRTVIRAPFHWQRSGSTRAVTARILDVSRPGDVVLAPDPLAITIAVTTTDVKTVAPRDYYMDYLRDDPSFDYQQRLALVHYVNDQTPGRVPGLAQDLSAVGVDVACTFREDRDRYEILRQAGFRPLLISTDYRCLRRS